MTLLASFYTAEGIVFVADSQIVREIRGDWVAGEPQRKIISVPGLGVAREGGVVGFFGLAEVRGAPMEAWLRERISERDRPRDPRAFADSLRDRIARDAPRTTRRKYASGFHLGAFEERNGVRVPVFCFVRNYSDRDAEPPLGARRGDYYAQEQLLGRDFASFSPHEIRRELRTYQSAGFPFWYRNGDLPFFGPLFDGIEAATRQILSRAHYRTPANLEQWCRIARTLATTASHFYPVLFSGGDPLIGRAPTVRAIPWPT